MEYKVISIYANENARWQGKSLGDALIKLLKERRAAARCLVTRGVAGCDENGQESTSHVEVLSFNLPLKIEIVLPGPEAETILPQVSEMVGEGIVGVSNLRVVSHRMEHQLIPRGLKVNDAMTADPERATPDTPLSQVLDTLLRSDFTGLPVVDESQRPVGIITDGDLLYRAGIPIRVRLMTQFASDDVRDMKQNVTHRTAREIMSSPVVTVGRDQYLFEAVDTMLKRGLRRLPVLDEDGALVGILARLDIFKAISDQASAAGRLHGDGIEVNGLRHAGDAMSAGTPTVSPDAPLEEVIRLLGNSAVERVAVVDDQGKLLGLISDRAMLGAFSENKKSLWDYLVRKVSAKDSEERHSELIRRYRETKAGQIMETDFAGVAADTPLDEAAGLMTEKRIKRLPVLDGEGRFLGMLRREALLRMGGAGRGEQPEPA